MKPSKILGVIIAVVQLVSVLAFVLSIYTVTSVLQSSMSGEGLVMELCPYQRAHRKPCPST